MDNRALAQRLREHARRLEDQQANLYRIKAYRRAAETVLGLSQPISDMVANQGRAGLRTLPGVGAHLAQAIESLVRTGDFPPERAPPAAAPVGDGRPVLGLRLRRSTPGPEPSPS
jgi:DNA polymerase/3'-5' exonuclease PolX